ncbi:diguanylate cyclase [Colwellia sp. D2M02]|uniref:GGDEF domain-containing protein n=1 Tax=Colwellia sp. D2M02 TaxID=2841562 RepID=UPI001C0860B0|nr:GGDEF domain-containing protein [Colwellia sp. D2M02]MBU2893810.1 diguanylate cyclase [Colwellia sp. D2M02]
MLINLSHKYNFLHKLYLGLFYALFILCSHASYATQGVSENNLLNIDSMLIEADKLRSHAPALGQEIITKLENNITKLSESQRHHLTYLSASKSIYQGNYLEGEKKFLALLTSNTSELIKFRANYSLINLYTLQQRWQEGLQQVAKVLTTRKSIEGDEHFKLALVSVIAFYNQIEQYQLALDYSEQLLHNISEKRTHCIVNQLVLLAKLETQKLSIKSNELTKGIEVCQQANEPIFTGIIRSYQARLHLNEKNADDAINALLPHLNAVKSTHYKVLISLTYNLLAQAYHLKSDIDKTKEYALLAEDVGGGLTKNKEIAATYKLLFQIAEQEGNFEQALYFHKKYSQATQKHLDEVQAKQIAFQLAKHNDYANKQRIEQQNQQIDLLSVQHLLTKKQAENSLLLIMLLIVFLMALALWAYKSWLVQQRLKQLTEYDSLTKVHSRGHFIQLAKSSLKHCQKTEQPLTCVLFDLDNFKRINDNYGHAIGDKTLKEVARVCRKIGRQNDILGRLGGEEFAYILPGCSVIIAEDIAQRCRLSIQQIDYKALGLNDPITASFGISDVAISGFELTDLLGDADSAMYASKEHGRNCVNTFR